MHMLRFSVFAAALSLVAICAAPAWAGHIPQCGADGYLDQFDALDIGQSRAFDNCPPVGGFPILGPVGPLLSPVTTGLVTGQFEAQCDPLTNNCLDVGYYTSNFDFRWGVYDVNAGSFVSGSGQTFFQPDPLNGPDEGMVSILPHVDNPSQFWIRINFRLNGSGVALTGTTAVPGRYILFAGISPLPLNDPGFPGGFTYVPGEGTALDPEGSILSAGALVSAPDQLHIDSPQEFVDDGGTGWFLTQVVTSRVILVVPEPTTGLLVLIGGACALIRRRRVSGNSI